MKDFKAVVSGGSGAQSCSTNTTSLSTPMNLEQKRCGALITGAEARTLARNSANIAPAAVFFASSNRNKSPAKPTHRGRSSLGIYRK